MNIDLHQNTSAATATQVVESDGKNQTASDQPGVSQKDSSAAGNYFYQDILIFFKQVVVSLSRDNTHLMILEAKASFFI